MALGDALRYIVRLPLLMHPCHVFARERVPPTFVPRTSLVFTSAFIEHMLYLMVEWAPFTYNVDHLLYLHSNNTQHQSRHRRS